MLSLTDAADGAFNFSSNVFANTGATTTVQTSVDNVTTTTKVTNETKASSKGKTTITVTGTSTTTSTKSTPGYTTFNTAKASADAATAEGGDYVFKVNGRSLFTISTVGAIGGNYSLYDETTGKFVFNDTGLLADVSSTTYKLKGNNEYLLGASATGLAS